MKKKSVVVASDIFDYISDAELERVLPHMNSTTRKRVVIECEVTSLKHNIKAHENNIKASKASIISSEKTIEEDKKMLEKSEKALKEVPNEAYALDELKAEIRQVAELEWVQTVHLKEGYLYITTKPGVLQTEFYERMAYYSGYRTTELLEEPLTLPLPTYSIRINLVNMGNAWTRSNALNMQLATPAETQMYNNGKSAGLSHQPFAHWATNESPYAWGSLCLGDYDHNLIEAGKRGLIEFMSELAVFLQSSGWSSAYRNKLVWAATLGFAPYEKFLLRAAEGRDDLTRISSERRSGLAAWLKKHGVSINRFMYGSDAGGTDMSEMPVDALERELVEQGF